MIEADLALRVFVAKPCAETVGAVLMDLLGPFQEEVADWGAGDECGRDPGGAGDSVALLFYPEILEAPSDEAVLAALPGALRTAGKVRLEWGAIPRDWVEGWKDHFRPSVIGGVRIRPPWEPEPGGAAADAAGPKATPEAPAAPDGTALVDVVINPGLGFGTGLHPTTRSTLELLQEVAPAEAGPEGSQGTGSRRPGSRGPLVDAGTGSGILSIAAAKLGWGPVVAFDNDPVALLSARDNVETNGVDGLVQVHEVEVAAAPPPWFPDATVLANMTLEPVLSLLRRLSANAGPETEAAMLGGPRRLVVSGILAGAEELDLLSEAGECGFAPGRRRYEAEWVSMELLPTAHRSAGAYAEPAAPGVPRRAAPYGGGPAGGTTTGKRA